MTNRPAAGQIMAPISAGASSFQSSIPFTSGQVLRIGTGDVTASCDNCTVAASGGTGPYTITTSGGVVANAHAAGESVRAYGPSHIIGSGNQGTPQGNGNGDYITGADSTHPTTTDHIADALRVSSLLASILPMN